MLVAVDIETSCKYGCQNECDHALHFKHNKIDVIGVYGIGSKNNPIELVFRSVDLFSEWLNVNDVTIVGHNFSFDIKSLLYQGVNIKYDQWTEDTYAQAVALVHKIPDKWLSDYEAMRMAVNKEFKTKHRKAKGYSLKTLAPYFLDVVPFWEVDDKNNDEYVLKDARYTYELHMKLNELMELDGTHQFYKDKLMNWYKTLTKAEYRGIRIDREGMEKKKPLLESELEEKKLKLEEHWGKYSRIYFKKLMKECAEGYKERYKNQLMKITEPNIPEKIKKLRERQFKLFKNKVRNIPRQLNLNSPEQMKWLLQDQLGYNLEDDKGKISTGKPVLKRLILEGKEDIIAFKDVRDFTKLLTSFYEKYPLMMDDKDIINCSFKIGGTRTGRLSAENPNLQQVPGSMRDIFIAREGYQLATYDMSAIEPNLIAYFSEDPVLCELLLSDSDFHGDATKQIVDYVTCTANEVKAQYKKERDFGKQVDLSLFYGSGKNMLIQTGLKHGFKLNPMDAAGKIRKFKERFNGVYRFKDQLDKVLEEGPVTNVLGRKYEIVDKDSIYMLGFNRLIQGSGSDLVLNSAYKVMKEFEEKGIDGHLLVLVHDEGIFEIPEDRIEECREIIIRNMTDYKLPTKFGDIKLKVEGGIKRHWEK